MINIGTLWRVVWPDRGPLFAVVGGIVSVVGDFASFLGNIASPELLIWPFVGLAGLLCWLCLGRVGQAPVDGAGGEHAGAIQCRECDAFRVMFFASVGVILLLLAGQGSTATEKIAAQLGLIQQGVEKIQDDTAAIRDVTSSAALLKSPRTAEEFFTNAWIHKFVRRDAVASWDAIQELYRRHTPNKLDAAELYFTAGRIALTRDQLLEQMTMVGRDRRDASMLVIAARNTDAADAASALREEARKIDPDLPFAYWDIFQTSPVQGSTPAESLAASERAVQGIQLFIEVAGRKPVSQYFYQPQYAPDIEAIARVQLETYRGGVANWRRAIEMQKR